MAAATAGEGRIRVGIGGWTYEPWRGGNFYPAGLAAAKELAWASRRLTMIEVNGTYYSTQRPSSFARWRDETPEDFVFSLKAHRLATNRRVLAEAGPSIAHFVGSGITELRDKLGPIVWQLPPSKRFDAADLEAFVRLLPRERDGRALRHALEVRHDSFRCPEYLALARRHGIATVFTDSDDYPSMADVTGDFVYVRTMRTQASEPQGCSPAALAAVAASAQAWRSGAEPAGVPRVEPAVPAAAPRDVFLLFISAAKEKAPAAAMGVIAALGSASLSGGP